MANEKDRLAPPSRDNRSFDVEDEGLKNIPPGFIREAAARYDAGIVKSLRDDELLALLVGPGAAELLCSSMGSLRKIARLSQEEMMNHKGIGKSRSRTLSLALELSRRVHKEKLAQQDLMRNPGEVIKYCTAHFANLSNREKFIALFIDSQNRLIEVVTLSTGTIDGAVIYPRTAVEEAIRTKASSVVFAHNHPSGVAKSSSADRRITERLQESLSVIDVRVLDHIIIGSGDHYSFAEAGLLY